MSEMKNNNVPSSLKQCVSLIVKRSIEFTHCMNQNYQEHIAFLEALIDQIPQSLHGPLIAKTPKTVRKKEVRRIETIPENDITQNEPVHSTSLIKDETSDKKVVEDIRPGRSKRKASQKAADNIKKQQSLTLSTKLRRLSNGDIVEKSPKKVRESQSKRRKASNSSDEEKSRPSKYTKIDTTVTLTRLSEKDTLQDEIPTRRITRSSNKRKQVKSVAPQHSNKELNKENTIRHDNQFDETIDKTGGNDTLEPSMYEDAISKLVVPVMNSTMNNINTTMTLDKRAMNATVILEPLPQKYLNETVTLDKQATSNSNSRKGSTNSSIVQAKAKVHSNSPYHSSKATAPLASTLQDRMKVIQNDLADKELEALLTDDESSPEARVIPERKSKTPQKTRKRRKPKKDEHSYLSSDDDGDVDEIASTPPKTALREINHVKPNKPNAYKPTALFSPYAKDSVKQRVNAFEQAGKIDCPSVDVEVPIRTTRTKTRAMAAAENVKIQANVSKTVAQKLARKSLAKAKRISLVKQLKLNEESKENQNANVAQKISKLLTVTEKSNYKQQLKANSAQKSRIPRTPNNTQPLSSYSRTLTAPRARIVSNVETFIQQSRTAQKITSTERLEENYRRAHEDDARRKREETLKAMSEEKRRKREEKELKNKLAREAKEKREQEKRLKAEREREEKAKLALEMQEKQKEEAEKKRIAQMERAMQKKEEKRKYEEQQRLKRLREQEEEERLVAEQKRREFEAERRRLAEARAQAAEAAKLRALKAKEAQNPTSYILDSEPDEDSSDNEHRPKYPIPYWARADVRKTHLAMQHFVPISGVRDFFGSKECTPDLRAMFNGINRNRLVRTSSAIWKTPPRFSMMSRTINNDDDQE
ncbi:inner centromere protein A isoform X2 [Cephus cinctus]|uniref:Inner centromere protein A isoform X2 n=1 Tax=Cephus cinctus TaxID=211228 RepID=A0AAJ7BG15_CEPCN|nr:inner centromere protein A isoform X2 [Cephus cinctus]